jgi:hypothetical protein
VVSRGVMVAGRAVMVAGRAVMVRAAHSFPATPGRIPPPSPSPRYDPCTPPALRKTRIHTPASAGIPDMLDRDPTAGPDPSGKRHVPGTR